MEVTYAEKLCILNVWEPIPLKLIRKLGQWWKCNKVVSGLIDSASSRMPVFGLKNISVSEAPC